MVSVRPARSVPRFWLLTSLFAAMPRCATTSHGLKAVPLGKMGNEYSVPGLRYYAL